MVSFNHPFRMQFPYDPPYLPTDLIIPNNKQIVAEHAYNYFYSDLNGLQLDYWESLYDAAGGAGEPAMPGIGQLRPTAAAPPGRPRSPRATT